MEKKTRTVGISVIASAIIGSAIIWGAVILGSSYALKGTECYDKIQTGLSLGFMSHLIFIWGPLAVLFHKTIAKAKKDAKAN